MLIDILISILTFIIFYFIIKKMPTSADLFEYEYKYLNGHLLDKINKDNIKP